MFSKLIFLKNYLKILFECSGPFKKKYIILIFLIFFNSIIEAFLTFSFLIFSTSYLNLSENFPDIFTNSENIIKNFFYKYNYNKDLLLIISLFITLIVRQISNGINTSYMHYVTNKVTEHIRTRISINHLKNNSTNMYPKKSLGFIQQSLSQDSKFTSQSLFFFIQSFSMLFYILFFAIILILISFTLSIISLLFVIMIIPFKIYFSKKILLIAKDSKNSEYSMMNNITNLKIIKIDKIKNNIANFRRKETTFRILMVWEPLIFQILGLLFICSLVYFSYNSISFNFVQTIAFSLVIIRTIPFITKSSKFFNSFISRYQLVTRTYNIYINK